MGIHRQVHGGDCLAGIARWAGKVDDSSRVVKPGVSMCRPDPLLFAQVVRRGMVAIDIVVKLEVVPPTRWSSMKVIMVLIIGRR